MPDSYAGLAEELERLAEEAAREALEKLAQQLRIRTIADIPIGDPRLDPDPEYALRDHVIIRQYGRFVTVTVQGEYAVKQHEALHFKHPRGGYPKFLERNAAVIAMQMEGQIAASLQTKFAGKKLRGRTRLRSIAG